MILEKERQLYETVCAMFTPQLSGQAIAKPVVYVEKMFGNQKVYIVGETHNTRDPIDLVHRVLVPKIEEDPASWLILRENARELYEDPTEGLDAFYFQELARLCGMPYVEALADFRDTSTRDHIKQQAEITDEELDRHIINLLLGYFSFEEAESLHAVIAAAKTGLDGVDGAKIRTAFSIVKSIATMGRMESKHVASIIFSSPLPDVRTFEEIVGRPWNDFSRQRFHRLRNEYSTKTNILVSVGRNHVPIFESD